MSNHGLSLKSKGGITSVFSRLVHRARCRSLVSQRLKRGVGRPQKDKYFPFRFLQATIFPNFVDKSHKTRRSRR